MPNPPPYSTKRGERLLTAEEKALWKRVTRHDIKHNPQDEWDEEMPAQAQEEPSSSTPPRAKAASVAVPTKKQPTFHPLTAGDTSGMDGRSAARFRKGAVPVDVTLDLHGCNQLDAYSLFADTVGRMASSGERVLMVITGKGKNGDGVLKQKLPQWINEPGIRPFILAFTVAKPKDGGATLILIKRLRPHLR